MGPSSSKGRAQSRQLRDLPVRRLAAAAAAAAAYARRWHSTTIAAAAVTVLLISLHKCTNTVAVVAVDDGITKR